MEGGCTTASTKNEDPMVTVKQEVDDSLPSGEDAGPLLSCEEFKTEPEEFLCDEPNSSVGDTDLLLSIEHGSDRELYFDDSSDDITHEVCDKLASAAVMDLENLSSGTADVRTVEQHIPSYNNGRRRNHDNKHSSAKAITKRGRPRKTDEHKLSGSSASKKFSCDICGKNVSSFSYLKVHYKKHEKIKNSGSRSSSVESTVQTKVYSCDICNKVLKNKASLVKHCRIHSPMKQYTCKVCGRSFNRGFNLKSHALMHSGEHTVYVCDICGKSYRRLPTMKTHRKIHQSSNPFVCYVCKKSFVTKFHLDTHVRRHNGEKPFNCTSCSKSFPCKSDLTQHEKRHTGDRPYCCCICSKRFIKRSHLMTHMEWHSNDPTEKVSSKYSFFCHVCGKTLYGGLAQHMQRHAGIKPYLCPDCSKSFFVASELKRHMKVHLSDSPFVCCICGVSYNLFLSLRKHYKQHVLD